MSRREQDTTVGQDSFLDTTANLVGILIILVVVVGAKTRIDAVEHSKKQAAEEEMPAVAESTQSASAPPHYIGCVRDESHITVEPHTKVFDGARAGDGGAGEVDADRRQPPCHLTGAEDNQLSLRCVYFQSVLAVPVGQRSQAVFERFRETDDVSRWARDVQLDVISVSDGAGRLVDVEREIVGIDVVE